MDQQQAIFKRKFEEAMEQNKRLEEAVDAHRKNFIDNELKLLYSALDLQNLLKSLENDQKVLDKHLSELRATEDKTEAITDQIKQLEDDLELRRAQINDMRSKQENMDEKIRKISEHLTSVPELRTAVSNLLKKLLDSRNDFSTKLTKANDRVKELVDENLGLKMRINKLKTKKDTSLTSSLASSLKRRITYNESDIEELSNDEVTVKSKDEKKGDPDYQPSSTGKKKAKIVCGCITSCKLKYCVCKKAGAFCNINCKCLECVNIDTKEGVPKQELIMHTC
jgi:chromosome segregation ATPase